MAFADEMLEQTVPSKTTFTSLKPDAKDSEKSPPGRTFNAQKMIDRKAVETAINALIRKSGGIPGGKKAPLLTGQMLLAERDAKIQLRERGSSGSTRQNFPLQHDEVKERLWLINRYPAYFRANGEGTESEDDDDDEEEEEDDDDSDGDGDAEHVKTESDVDEDPDMKEDGPEYHTSDVGTAISGGKYITTKIAKGLLTDAFRTGGQSEASIATVGLRGSLSSEGVSKRVWRIVGGELQVWPPFGAAVEAQDVGLNIKRKAGKVDIEEGGAAKKARN